MQIPEAITKDLRSLLPKLRELGFEPTNAEYSAWHFGNYVIDFRGAAKSFRIVRDRLQYYLDSETEDFRGTALHRAYDQLEEFEHVLLPWLGAV